jgi:hypothetical protein
LYASEHRRPVKDREKVRQVGNEAVSAFAA